jgi:hypothetical protein
MAGMREKPSQPDDAVSISPISATLLWLVPVGAAYAWMAGAERTGALALIAVGIPFPIPPKSINDADPLEG